jgi:dephospho-CoA kinase
MKVFGLTGGIGMGKTTAGNLLGERAVPIIDTDVLAREIVEPGRPALQEIQRAFGNQVIGPDGQLRREELARIVFSDTAARQKLENITHPRIRELWQAQIAQWRRQAAPSAVVVIPLLFETGAESALDATICVACSAATQRRRLAERGWTAEQITERLAAQWPIEEKMTRADYVAWNEGRLEVLAEQLDRIFFGKSSGRATAHDHQGA